MMAENEIKIAFVEDNKTDVFVFEKKVKQLEERTGRRYALDIFNDYNSAKNEILKTNADMYFIDYMLDEHAGLDLIKSLNEKGCKGPYIMLTNFDEKAFYSQGADIGIYDYIIKSELTDSLLERSILYTLKRKQIE